MLYFRTGGGGKDDEGEEDELWKNWNLGKKLLKSFKNNL